MRFLILYIFYILSLTASAGNSKLSQKQFKKDISTVRTNIKNDKDLEQCEKTLRKYLSDSLYAKDKNLHILLTECLRKQYDAVNEKMYLKEKVDTAQTIRTSIRLFLAIEALDSIDATPDHKGVVSPSYRKKHAEYITPFWGNLLKGGIYFYAHGNWKEAWQCFDTYLDCYRQPLFSEEKLDSTQYNFAAFLATMSAYNMSDISLAQKYATAAIDYTPRKEMIIQRLADLSIAKGDTVNYIYYIDKGNKEFPYSNYFFPNLIDYYSKAPNLGKALEYANEALDKDSLNATFLLARHNVLMLMQNYDKALADGISLLSVNDTLAIPNYNVACIYFQKAQDAMRLSGKSFKQRLKQSQQYYRLCKPYIEMYRKLKPDDKKLWRPILYDVYLNLNMGKEFDSLPKP